MKTQDKEKEIQILSSDSIFEENLLNLLYALNNAAFLTNDQGIIIHMTQQAEKISGWSFEQARNQPIQEVVRIFHPSTNHPLNIPLETSKNTPSIGEFPKQVKLISKQKQEYLVISTLVAIKGRKDSLKGFVLILQETRQEIRLKQKIKEIEIRYRELFNNTNNCVAVYKPVENGNDFLFVDFNRAAELTDQISKEELIGKKVTAVFPGIGEFGLLDIMKKVSQTGEMEKHPILKYTDNRISGWRENHVYRLPSGEIVVIYSDTTKQKLDEERLGSQYTLLQMAGKSAKFGGWSVDLEKNIATWSDQVADIHKVPHGYAPPVEEGIRFYAPEYQQKITQVFKDCAQKGIPYDEEMQIITSQGKRVWVRTVGEAARDEDGKIVRIQGSFQDISLRKKVEESLRIEREQLLALFDSIEQAIYVSDPNSYEVLFVNKYLRNLLDEDPIGGICYRVFQGLDEPCEFCTNEIIFQDIGKPYTWEYHNPLLDRDYLITDKAIRWVDDRDVRFEITIDITQHKLAEQELRVLKDSLEQQVNEKTQELQVRVQELERFHDATIQREIRMKELRDEIKRLKGESDA